MLYDVYSTIGVKRTLIGAALKIPWARHIDGILKRVHTLLLVTIVLFGLMIVCTLIVSTYFIVQMVRM